jgi:hypothetical protein
MSDETPSEQEQLDAIKRVLDLVYGYIGTQNQGALLSYDGGLMTWGELKEQLDFVRQFPVLGQEKE